MNLKQQHDMSARFFKNDGERKNLARAMSAQGAEYEEVLSVEAASG